MIATLLCRQAAGLRALRRFCAAAALTLFGLTGTSGGADAQVAAPAPDRLWGGCQLPPLFTIPGVGDFDFLVLYSLVFPNDGQPFFTPGAPPQLAGFTGPIVCTAPGVSIESSSEAVNISDIDVLPSVLGTAIRYREGTGFGTRFKKQLCHQIRDTIQCYTVEFGGGGDCTIPQSQYNTIRETVRAGLPPFTDSTALFIGYSVVVAYTLNSSQQPKVCATPVRKLSSTGEVLTGQVLDAENISALNYTTSSNKPETRLCHSVADKTDCFRIFKP